MAPLGSMMEVALLLATAATNAAAARPTSCASVTQLGAPFFLKKLMISTFCCLTQLIYAATLPGAARVCLNNAPIRRGKHPISYQSNLLFKLLAARFKNRE